MSRERCPLCESECIVKKVAMEDERWREVDVCSLCGTMYPRGRLVVQVKSAKASKKAGLKKSKKR